MKPKLMSRHAVLFLSMLLALYMLTPLQEVQASSPTDIVAFTAGSWHNLAVKGDGTVWAWGDNYYGELGDGTFWSRTVPVQVQGLDGVTTVAASFGHSVAVKADGTVWTWGANYSGQLGDGTYIKKLAPIQVPGLTGVVSVKAGEAHNVALKQDGTVWTWGDNYYGQLGDGTDLDRSIPLQVAGLSDVTAVAAGGFFSFAQKSDGTIWGWGDNYDGELGDGTTTKRFTPVLMQVSDVIAMAPGMSDVAVLKRDGTVWTWGYNWSGQLGDGTVVRRLTPLQVPGLTGVKAVAARDSVMIALKEDGTVWAWGENAGDGSLVNQLSPVQVAQLSGVASISAGSYHALALRADNTLWAWGDNMEGELGDGSFTNRSTRTPVKGLGTAITPFASVTGAPTSVTSSASATLSVGGTGIVSYKYKLDAGAYSAETSTATPIALASLSHGTHLVAVLGKNAAGEWQTEPTTAGWSVDLVPPTVIISSAPPPRTNATTATFNLAGDEVWSYKYSLDGGSYSTEFRSSGIAINNLGEGTHTVSFIARDYAGNWQLAPATATWTVDLTPPSATVSGAPAVLTAATGATLTVGGADVAAYKYQLDGGGYSGERPVSGGIALSGLADGTHTVSVLGKDAAGNWQLTPTVVSWTVDATAPLTTAAPGSGYFILSGAVSLSCSDGSGSGCAAIRYCTGAGCTPTIPYTGPITINATTDLRFYSTDAAGNGETVKTVSYQVVAAEYAVNVSVVGSGAVASAPAGISTTGSGSMRFPEGATVTLQASPAEFFIFSGWSGACGGSGDCVLSVTADRAVTALFSLDVAHSTSTGAGLFSPTINSAFEATVQNDIIRLWGIEFTEDVLFAADKRVALRGGYNHGYSQQASRTVLRGSLRISGGTVDIDRVAIR